MEYVYGAMLLHAADKDINEENIKEVMKAGGVSVDDARAKAIVSALEGVDIDEAISKTAAIAPATASAPAEKSEPEKKAEEKKAEPEEEEKTEEEAASGLASLFG